MDKATIIHNGNMNLEPIRIEGKELLKSFQKEPATRWIDVTLELPELSGYYLVCYKNFGLLGRY